MGVVCPGDFGANLVPTLYVSVLAIFTISNGTLKTKRDNFDFVEISKSTLLMQGAFFRLNFITVGDFIILPSYLLFPIFML